MAEIHVQPKKTNNANWLWIILGLLILGAIAYYLYMRNEKKDANTVDNEPAKTSYVLPASALQEFFTKAA